MKNIGLVYVYVHRVVFFDNAVVDVVLYRGYFMVGKQLFARYIPCKSSYAVVHGYYVAVKAAYKVVEC